MQPTVSGWYCHGGQVCRQVTEAVEVCHARAVSRPVTNMFSSQLASCEASLLDCQSGALAFAKIPVRNVTDVFKKANMADTEWVVMLC